MVRPRIDSLQTVRALAFFCIFSQHCGIGSLGAFGVSVFLILSGLKGLAIVFYGQNTLGQSKKVLFIVALYVSIAISECYLFLERKVKKKDSVKRQG